MTSDGPAGDPTEPFSPSVACPDENVLGAYAEGQLDSRVRAAIEAHLDLCAECLTLVCEVARANSATGALDPTTPDRSAPTGAPSHVALGSLVGRYRIVRLLGQGGMGSVYEAYDPQLDRKVAVKVVRAGRVDDPSLHARLAREARTMAKLSHPNVVTVFDAGEFGRDFFIAMELVDGVTLAAWLRESDRSYGEVMRMMLAAGRGLAAAHAAGIVHRDFKPDNVLIDMDGRVAVTDFGLAAPPARTVREDLDGIDVPTSSLAVTNAGVVVGTPRYMSPEQHEGAKLDPRSDQFSFAVAVYEAVYKQRPFDGYNLEDIRRAANEGHVREPPTGTGVPAHVQRSLVRALSPSPHERFASLDALMSALAPLQAATDSRWLGWGALGLMIVTIFGTFSLSRASGRARGATPPITAAPPSRRAGGRTPTLIVAMDNRSREALFDDTIDAVIAEALSASKRVDVFAPFELRALASELKVEPDASLDSISEALLTRDGGVAAIASATLRETDGGLRLSVEIRDAATGESLLQTSREATAPSDLIAAAVDIGGSIRLALGDVPGSQQTENIALSGSLEAVHEWAVGQRLLRTGDPFSAAPHLRAAVRLDPQFTLAHADLGLALYDTALSKAAAKESAIALNDAERLGERRRLKLLGDYYGAAGRYAESIAAYEQLLGAWPGDLATENAVTATAIDANEWPLAIELSRRAAADHPGAVVARQNLVLAELAHGAFEDAAQDGEETIAEFGQPPRFTFAHTATAEVLLGRHTQALETLRRLEAFDPEYADESRADLAGYEGRLDDQIGLLEGQIDQAAARHDPPAFTRTEQLSLAEVRLRRGDTARARVAATAASADGPITGSDLTVYQIARVLVACGREEDALALTRGWADGWSPETRMYAALLRGDILRVHGHVREALVAYQDAERIVDSWYVHERLGQAYLLAHAWADADRELTFCIAHRGVAVLLGTPNLSLLPAVYYALARAKEGAREPGAAAAWETFLALEPHDQGDPLAAEGRHRVGAHPRPVTNGPSGGQ